MLKAAIQFPIQRVDSFDLVNKVFAELAATYIRGHSQMEHPLSMRLVPRPETHNFFGEIWVPLCGPGEINRALELFTRINQIYLSAHREEPELYKTKTRYGLANKTAWFTAPILLDKGRGDCKDLSAYRAAWLRVHNNEPGAKCYLKWVKRGQWHVQVQRGNGRIEDPSEKLGMSQYLRENPL